MPPRAKKIQRIAGPTRKPRMRFISLYSLGAAPTTLPRSNVYHIQIPILEGKFPVFLRPWEPEQNLGAAGSPGEISASDCGRAREVLGPQSCRVAPSRRHVSANPAAARVGPLSTPAFRIPPSPHCRSYPPFNYAVGGKTRWLPASPLRVAVGNYPAGRQPRTSHPRLGWFLLLPRSFQHRIYPCKLALYLHLISCLSRPAQAHYHQ